MGRGRPATGLGTFGTIHTVKARSGAYRARARIRDADGVTRQITATATTPAAAERALRTKLAQREAPAAAHSEITRDTTLTKLGAVWIKFLRAEDRIEATTINEYQRVLDNVITPGLGSLRLREATTSRLDVFLIELRAVSSSRQRKAKVVLSAMLGLAVRHDALTINPVQQTSRLRREKSETRSLNAADVEMVRTAVRTWAKTPRPGPKANNDMPDIIELMLATGARIGEVLALRWADVNLHPERPTVTISGTVKSEPGKGTYRKPSPKTDSGLRTIMIPGFAVAVLQRRWSSGEHDPGAPVIPTRNGTWHQVTNVERRWRQIRKDTGLEWVTPHTFRKTVATLIAERVDAETAAQQLGHSSPDITRQFYIAKPAIAADVAHVLDELAQQVVAD